VQTVEIKPDVMLSITQRAEKEGKPIPDIIDEMLRPLLGVQAQATMKCHNCRNEIDYEVSENKGYCDYCESVVFMDNC
jgi:hypothetical protein